MEGKELFPYQKEGVELIVNRFRHVLLADPPGAGKTAQAIVAAHKLAAKSILVVCPASLRLNWQRELTKWGETCWKAVPVLSSREFHVVWSPSFEGALIVSYELATSFCQDLAVKLWDLLILDESHFLKSWKTKRTRACLRTIKPSANKVIALTGTPLPNGRAIEAHPVFASFCPAVFGKWKEYVERYCVKQVTPWGVQHTKSKNLAELGRLARDHFMIRRSKEEVLKSLPPLVRQQVPLEVDTTVTFTERLRDELESLEAGETLNPNHSEHISTARRLHGCEKIPGAVCFVRDLLEEAGHVVVFAHHREVIEGLINGFKEERISYVTLLGNTSPADRQKAVDYFQAGHAQVFLGSLLAASTGITLTRASAVVMVEYDWVPSNNEQAEGRCYRVTQKDITRVFYLYVPNSLDEAVMAMVLRKQKDIGRVMGEEPLPDSPAAAY